MKIDAGGLEIRKLREFGAFLGATLLEVGCGDGRVTAQLAGRVDRLVALDPSAHDLRKAAVRIKRALFCMASGEWLPFPDDCFDTVLFTLSLHHQDSPRAMQEAARVVSPTGRILVMEPTLDSEVQQLFHLFENETAALEAAQAAITASSLQLVREKIFEADWSFPHKDDFSRYMFSYHDMAWNAAMEARLFLKLGAKVDDQPLVLKDKLRLQHLNP
jgi:ubiquinone/menaquinone biosynthesis C-methylase UbiE